MRLPGKVAVVTGGASGIGRAIALRFAAEGARVVVLDCAHSDVVETMAPNEGATGTTFVEVCDVTDEASVIHVMQRIAADFGPIQVLVNNAGISIRHPIHEEDTDTWRRILDVNLTGVFFCTREAMRHFHPEGGSIIHMSSVVGVSGLPNRAAYTATKAALVGLARNMAMDYASRRIRVNCICPGFTRTPLLAPIYKDPERLARIAALHPLGRLGEPDDIANAALFLASDESSWITGQALVVDGGMAAGHPDSV